MKPLLFAALFLVYGLSYAQKLPWSDLPESATVEAIPQPVTGYLTLDSLEHVDSLALEQSGADNFWTANKGLVVGAGYLSRDGQPVGIWRYYTLENQTYELFCEGYYLRANTSRVITPKEGGEDFKKTAVEESNKKLMHCGEWRFYHNGKLQSRLILDNRTKLRLHAVSSFDNNGNETAEEMVLPKKWRLIGDVLIQEKYHPNGKLKLVKGPNGYLINVAEDGTSEIPAMLELPPLWNFED